MYYKGELNSSGDNRTSSFRQVSAEGLRSWKQGQRIRVHDLPTSAFGFYRRHENYILCKYSTIRRRACCASVCHV